MYKDGRDIYFYDAHPRIWHRKYKGLKPFPHYEMARSLKEMFDKDVAERIHKSTHQAIYVTAMSILPKRCEMLVGFSDTVAANPTLHDRPKRKRRVVSKRGDEGIEHSAHIIWHYGSQDNADPCPFYLEGATGLRSSTIVTFFNGLLRIYAKGSTRFEVDDPEGAINPDGTFKSIPTRPRIELLGHPSSQFIKDLKKGTLSEVELYTESQHSTPWDANAYAVEDRRGVVIKPNSAKLLPKAKAILDGILTGKVKNDYEYARVSFKTETDVARSVRIFSNNYGLVNDDSYVRKERLSDIGDDLPNAFGKVYPPIIKGMRALAGIT